MKKIYVTNLNDLSGAALEMLYRLGELTNDRAGADVIFCNDISHITKWRYRRAKYVITNTTGIDHIDSENWAIISLQGETDFLEGISSTAEHTLRLILNLLKPQEGPMLYSQMARKAWEGKTLLGKNVLIVGGGRVGKQMNSILTALGCDVVIIDKHVAVTYCMIHNADIITIHMDLNDSSEGWFDEKTIKNIKEGAYIVNTARGALIDEEALLLHHGKLSGIALDVLCGEPMPPNLQRFRDLPNCIITPHVAGNTLEDKDKTTLFVLNKYREMTGYATKT